MVLSFLINILVASQKKLPIASIKPILKIDHIAEIVIKDLSQLALYYHSINVMYCCFYLNKYHICITYNKYEKKTLSTKAVINTALNIIKIIINFYIKYK